MAKTPSTALRLLVVAVFGALAVGSAVAVLVFAGDDSGSAPQSADASRVRRPRGRARPSLLHDCVYRDRRGSGRPEAGRGADRRLSLERRRVPAHELPRNHAHRWTHLCRSGRRFALDADGVPAEEQRPGLHRRLRARSRHRCRTGHRPEAVLDRRRRCAKTPARAISATAAPTASGTPSCASTTIGSARLSASVAGSGRRRPPTARRAPTTTTGSPSSAPMTRRCRARP